MKKFNIQDFIRWILSIILLIFVWNENKYALYLSITLAVIAFELDAIKLKLLRRK